MSKTHTEQRKCGMEYPGQICALVYRDIFVMLLFVFGNLVWDSM